MSETSPAPVRTEEAARLTYREPYPGAHPPGWLVRWLPADPAARARWRLAVVRTLIVLNLLAGTWYLSWRWLAAINWTFWWVAVPLIAAETYSYLDSCLFGITMWRWRSRGNPPPPEPGATVDLFVTTYNEPVELVRQTVRAARDVRWPHRTYLLDDGNRPAMRAMADEEGAHYLTRSADWSGHERHAKAGNLINALHSTSGEFLAVLDADQIAAPEFLHRTLGYFRDPTVAFVQTTQFFYNVSPDDRLGCQAPLFYGPLQEGKDGWNAAFFCGSNAVLRREALMQLGLADYVQTLERQVRQALNTADRLLQQTASQLPLDAQRDRLERAVGQLRAAIQNARAQLRAGVAIQEVTWAFQRQAEAISRVLVADDLARIRTDLAGLAGVDLAAPAADAESELAALDEFLVQDLAARDRSPLTALAAVRAVLLAVDVDRASEAMPVLPLATIAVTEDMATAQRLHALGWRSVYHNETLVEGLAPEDLSSALQQRLRWAQGTLQIMFRENPLTRRGLSVAQRLSYFATMWSYLSGAFTLVYLLEPVGYLGFGWLPVRAFSATFFLHLVPYLLANELLFWFVGWGRPTWRGRQYSIALFPLWIRALWTSIGNVYFGRPLGFVITPKVQGGEPTGSYRLIQWQLAMIALLAGVSALSLIRLVLGLSPDPVPILVNLAWAVYDIAMLRVVVVAWRYRPARDLADRDRSAPAA
jgi:cellulose synthase (UDP-forming)